MALEALAVLQVASPAARLVQAQRLIWCVVKVAGRQTLPAAWCWE
jgi:hypothetical protein